MGAARETWCAVPSCALLPLLLRGFLFFSHVDVGAPWSPIK